MKRFSILFFALLIFGCKNEPKVENLSADDIINKSIEVAGGDSFNKSEINFDFRDRHYYAKRNHGDFLLMRVTINANNDSIYDVLTNAGYERKLNDMINVVVPDSMITKYSASVNSVHYFSVLPYGLNDKAVNKTLIGEEEIKAKNYYKIQVTFDKNGGGEDYEDVFLYWIDKESFKVDYLAYSYNEADGKGMRFREAYNERYVNGLRFVDYNNYKPKDKSIKLQDLGKAFENNQLELLSKIELENVTVDLIDLQ
ncbi:DUF6503 family protein [Winogradskyella ouciana]|uniref:Deoxyribose-phosphate aldolase n=1 Tax=Winogradskyella ouciana TaxID=2608631 RepID=A0A7K1GAF3_9FLAO|nr:DUF6503 family protein [Winogradskyella ouciana]MTE25368.1 deoxyribose-phosphate aldolase [Winogradskyella ouciana]